MTMVDEFDPDRWKALQQELAAHRATEVVLTREEFDLLEDLPRFIPPVSTMNGSQWKAHQDGQWWLVELGYSSGTHGGYPKALAFGLRWRKIIEV